MTNQVRTGLDILADEQFRRLKGKRVGVVANQSTVDRQLRHIVDLLADSRDVDLVRVLAPEHGLRGAYQDMEKVGSGVDPRTGIPVITLYGGTYDSLKPRQQDLSDLDCIIVDLPDVGTRYYTYAQTMAFVMEVAGQLKKPVLVLDRPNPLNGIDVEGSPLKKACQSFCGLTPIAQRHGLTLGELARVYQDGFGEGDDRYAPIPCDLEVVKMEGWSRDMYFDDTGLPWVIPSPNMPTLDTAIVYPGGCLFEATEVSEARGTTRPFEFAGAPFIDGFAWAKATLEEKIPLDGAILRPITFIPKFQKCKETLCGGIQIHVTNRKTFRSLRWGLAMIAALKRLYPNDFKWRSEPYEFIHSVPAIDLLYGSPSFRETIEKGGDLTAVEKELQNFESWFMQARKRFLLY
jgi:uncharacterized protein YbbC (DUF1343 family)